jgi:hypothetical protein
MSNTLTKRELRKFALVMAGALSFFGTISLLLHHQSRGLFFFSTAGLFVFLGSAWPMALRPVQRIWMRLAHFLSWINTKVILGLFFFLVITPCSLVMKLVGRDVLRRKLDRSCPTYWHRRKPAKPATQSYEHLY